MGRLAATTSTLVAWSAPASAQCIMCRTALATPEGQALIEGFRSGILFLIAVPFVALATIGYFAIRSQRRLASQAGSAQPARAAAPDARPAAATF